MDASARSRIAVQTWFFAFAILILSSIVGLKHFRGVVAPDPALPSGVGVLSSVALGAGVLGLLALLMRSRSVAIARAANSLAGSVLFVALVGTYCLWLIYALLAEISLTGKREELPTHSEPASVR